MKAELERERARKTMLNYNGIEITLRRYDAFILPGENPRARVISLRVVSDDMTKILASTTLAGFSVLLDLVDKEGAISTLITKLLIQELLNYKNLGGK